MRGWSVQRIGLRGSGACAITVIGAALSVASACGNGSPDGAPTDSGPEGFERGDAGVPVVVAEAGDDDVVIVQPNPLLVGVTEIAAGGNRTCARRRDGAIFCWGSRDLVPADGNSNCHEQDDYPKQIALPPSAHVATGPTHSCAVTATGDVWCWGDNRSGELGNGSVDATFHDVPVQVVDTSGAPLTAMRDIAAGPGYACAIGLNDAVSCWGSNTIAAADGGAQTRGTVMPSGTDIATFATGDQDFCGVTKSGPVVECWNRFGNYSPPPAVGTASPVRVALGDRHKCVFDSSSQVFCDGLNIMGQTGFVPPDGGAYYDTFPPVQAFLGVSVAAIAAGTWNTCAVTTAGAVVCIGSNFAGQLGLGFKDSLPHAANTMPARGTRASMVAIGYRHVCSLLPADGSVECWGLGNCGQLGGGFDYDSPLPATVLAPQ